MKIVAAILAVSFVNIFAHNAVAQSIDESDAQSMVDKTCRQLRSMASFKISGRCDFDVEDVVMFGSEAVIDVFSEGAFYDIRFEATYNVTFSNDGGHYRYRLLSVRKK